MDKEQGESLEAPIIAARERNAATRGWFKNGCSLKEHQRTPTGSPVSGTFVIQSVYQERTHVR